VLVVDEPMVGLDPHSIRLVKDLLQWEVSQGMCVLMSTHTLGAAEEISHRVGIMSHGRLAFDGTIGELRQRCGAEQQSLEAMYLSITAQSLGRNDGYRLGTDAPAERRGVGPRQQVAP
jgi:ABC-2 type transport system ATP-binding protein